MSSSTSILSTRQYSKKIHNFPQKKPHKKLIKIDESTKFVMQKNLIYGQLVMTFSPFDMEQKNLFTRNSINSCDGLLYSEKSSIIF